MTIGTRSMLYGVHAFWAHPVFVFFAWVRLYRRLPGWSELVAIVFHDSYWGCHDIDGTEGKLHPRRGAKWARRLGGKRAEELVLFHSRSYAQAAERNPSALSNPDKFSFLLEPEWFYRWRATLSGEMEEFRRNAILEEGMPAGSDWFSHYKNMVINEFSRVVYLPLGRGIFAKVDSDCPLEILQQKWYARGEPTGRLYAYRTPRKSEGSEKSYVSLHRQIAGVSGCEVDHINGDTLDNRRVNLRACSPPQNRRNLRKWSSSTSSKYKGTCKRPSGQWMAYISFGRKQAYLGLFDEEEDAARAYDTAAKEFFGDFAKLNFP